MQADILSMAQQILGPPVRLDERRGWGDWWCPFHPDQVREGTHGRPNFGINLEEGYWKCLRCGASGGSLTYLSQRLGKYVPPPVEPKVYRPSRTEALTEAMSEARAALMRSPAWDYLQEERGLTPHTILTYGLGYGLPHPKVSRATLEAATDARLVRHSGVWLWAGGVVYADPPITPTVLNVRYLKDEQLPAGTRDFTPEDKHKTWGTRLWPLGFWRARPSTSTLVVVEGLVDMLIMAQALHQRGIPPEEAIAVYTNGSSPARTMLDWFRENGQFNFILVRDPDDAGLTWEALLQEAIGPKPAVALVPPPDGLDPDEAILSGWWITD